MQLPFSVYNENPLNSFQLLLTSIHISYAYKNVYICICVCVCFHAFVYVWYDPRFAHHCFFAETAMGFYGLPLKGFIVYQVGHKIAQRSFSIVRKMSAHKHGKALFYFIFFSVLPSGANICQLYKRTANI